MSVQPGLFDAPPPGRGKPRARKGDPLSSHDAITKLEKRGGLVGQFKTALEMVRAHPGLTSKELGEFGPLDYHQVARRLGELHDRGVIVGKDLDGRVRGEEGCGELHWWPA